MAQDERLERLLQAVENAGTTVELNLAAAKLAAYREHAKE